MLDKTETQALISTYRDGLLLDTLPFWTEHAVDREFGGFITALDRDGSALDTDKGMWQQGRFTWMLAHLYNHVEPRTEWLELAMHGYRFIGEHGFDHDGRMWFHVTREGKPIRKRRYAFTETFATIAFAALAKATGDDAIAQQARDLFHFYRDYLNSGVTPAKFTDTRPSKGIGVPMIDIATCQVLRETIDMPGATERIDQCIEEIERDFLNHDLRTVMETVGPHGEFIDHLDGRTLNPGHAIEAAWFIMREAKHRNDSHLLKLGLTMLDWMWEKGWDQTFGGILYFVDAKGLPCQEYWHDMKFWWPHCEAIIATLLAYQMTGDEKYAKWHRLVHDWSYAHFPDQQYGDWYGYLHRDGSVSSRAKGNHFKGPFHLPRMQWYCWDLLNTSSH